jgi:superfamily II DNA or RNA helicase
LIFFAPFNKMPFVLQRGGHFLPAGEFRGEMKGVLAKLTHVFTPKIGPMRISRCWVREGDKIVLPRRFAIAAAHYGVPIVDRLPNGEDLTQKISFDLTPNQQCVHRAVMDEMAHGACLLDMPAGQGKTILAASVISALGRTALYVVHLTPLAKQVRDEFLRVGMNAEIFPKIGETTIITVQSLLRQKYDFASYGTIVVDEVHKYASAKWRGVFKYTSRYALGMSGTICDRADRPEIFYTMELCMGGAREPLRAKALAGWREDLAKFPAVVHAIYYTASPEYGQNIIHESTGKIFTPFMDKQFMSDPRRLQIIVDEIARLMPVHTGIYVFCSEREPLGRLCAVLQESACLHGCTPRTEQAAVIFGAKVILTTYGFSSTGLSLPRMTAVILATPRRSGTEQTIKRIMRHGSDMEITREIIDIIDCATALRRQFSARKKTYIANDIPIQRKYIE